jgi:hypothetical protein
MNIQYQNAIALDVLDEIIADYNSRDSYETATMNKSDPGKSLDALHKICEQLAKRKLEYVGGNFYKHSVPYLPHTDYKRYQDNTLNVVIPLSYTGTLPNLVVFDQIWDLDSVTWSMHYPVQYFSVNIGVKGCPHEYPVQELTGKPIDDQLYSTHLTHYPKPCLYGLSGTAYPFEPGSVIMFDNRNIHCTSNFIGEKLGISLRFKA